MKIESVSDFLVESYYQNGFINVFVFQVVNNHYTRDADSFWGLCVFWACKYQLNISVNTTFICDNSFTMRQLSPYSGSDRKTIYLVWVNLVLGLGPWLSCLVLRPFRLLYTFKYRKAVTPKRAFVMLTLMNIPFLVYAVCKAATAAIYYR